MAGLLKNIVNKVQDFVQDARKTSSSWSSDLNTWKTDSGTVKPVTSIGNAKTVSSTSAPAVIVPKSTNVNTNTYTPSVVQTPTVVTSPTDSNVIPTVGGNSVDLGGIVQSAQKIADSNNARLLANTMQAQEFNAQEAQKNRDWQEMMSNTAFQRQTKDLLAAGLNPVLWSVGGSGASVGSGATASSGSADVDTGITSLLGNYITSLINSATQINSANISANAQQTAAGISAKATQYLADANRSATRYSANASAITRSLASLAYLLPYFMAL